MEYLLRKFSAFGEGETFIIQYNKKTYPIKVLEVKPKHTTRAVSIIETDVQVEFAPPADQKEEPTINIPTQPIPTPQIKEEIASPGGTPKSLGTTPKGFNAFSGPGLSLKDSPKPTPTQTPSPIAQVKTKNE